MAEGVTWDQRSTGDWLASNGKWYPLSEYPRSWHTSALPPAPGQGGVGSVLRQYATKVSDVAGFDGPGAHAGTTPAPNAGDGNSSTPPSASALGAPRQPIRTKKPPTSRPTSSKPSGFSVMDPGRRRVADATVTDESDYAHKVGAGGPPPKQLPPPPGRVSEGSNAQPSGPSAPPPRPSVPAVQETPAPPAPPASPGGGSFDVIAGDFGRVLGGARKRIEEALNDAYENNK